MKISKNSINIATEKIKTIPATYWTYEMNQDEKVKYLLIYGTGLFAAAYVFYHSLILSLLLTGLTYPGLKPYCSYLAEKRRKLIKEQFRDVLYSISASISSGRQMPEALFEAKENMILIYGENSLIVMELSDMVRRLYEYRESEDEILKDFALRTGVEDIADFVDIYLTCRATGGDFVRVLSKASEIIMDKIIIEKEIRTIIIQKQFEARILTAIPFVIILFLQFAAPEYLAVMYEGIQGRILMTMALVGIAVAYYWSMRLTKIEV